MNRRRKNSSLWYIAALALLLCIAFFVTATGTAFARYVTKIRSDFAISVKESEKIVIGTVTIAEDGETEKFFHKEPKWVISDSTATAVIAVANGTSQSGYSQKDQEINLRFIAGIGLLEKETDAEKIKLVITDENDPEQKIYLKAKAEALATGTALYHAHGEGWVISFIAENGEEYSEILPAGGDKFVKFTVLIEGGFTEDIIIYPTATAKIIAE